MAQSLPLPSPVTTTTTPAPPPDTMDNNDSPSRNAFSRFASAIVSRVPFANNSNNNNNTADTTTPDIPTTAKDLQPPSSTKSSRSPSPRHRSPLKSGQTSLDPPTPSPQRSRTPSPRQLTSNTLSVPAMSSSTSGSSSVSSSRAFLGAIPRHNVSSTESEPTSTASTTPSGASGESRRCFCGYYQEVRPRIQNDSYFYSRKDSTDFLLLFLMLKLDTSFILKANNKIFQVLKILDFRCLILIRR